MPLVQTFLEDIEERLSNASTWRQLNRPLGRLPKAKADVLVDDAQDLVR